MTDEIDELRGTLAKLDAAIKRNASGRPSGQNFSHEECFGEARGSVAFYTAQPQQRPERLLVEPLSPRLGWEHLKQALDLVLAEILCKRHEQIGPPKVAVIFHDLVFENHVVSPGVPGQLRDETVVLMPVVVVVGQDEVRHKARLEILEGFLKQLALERKEAATQPMNDD